MNIDYAVKNPKKIAIDSRTLKRGDIFLAIKGENFDGHDFVQAAFEKGAKAAIVSRPCRLRESLRDRAITVKDTIRTLGDIAHEHRRQFKIPVVAITGSNGKTTAKDMTAHVLESTFNVLKNESSKNNLIGLPLTLLQLEKRHDIAVLEMGMNHLGEIDRLSEIAEPQVGVVTNIGFSHIEFLGTLKNVFIAKSELLNRLKKDDVAILNCDDQYLRRIKSSRFNRIYYGINHRCKHQAVKPCYKENYWSFSLKNGNEFKLGVLGRHNIYNALISIAVAREFRIAFPVIAERINSYRQVCPMRLELSRVDGIEILNDSYNSNPSSFESSLDTLLRYKTHGKRIIIAGDMLELGNEARSMHEEIGRAIAASSVNTLITLGDMSSFIRRIAKDAGMKDIYEAKSHRSAADFLKRVAKSGDVVLIKGSRAMRMEKVLECFERS
ncbi:MAG: UDP-N-acetylmuramoyl-tripeptide--D-alanyl-D-alanine ligase [Candidatus Omnitrophota bacterium]